MRSRTIRYWTISRLMVGSLLAAIGGAPAFAQQPPTHDFLASLPEAGGAEAHLLRGLLESAQTTTTLTAPADSLALEGEPLVEGLLRGHEEGAWVEAYADLYSETAHVPQVQGIVVLAQPQPTALQEPDTPVALSPPVSLPAAGGVEPAHELAVSASMINFGTVHVNSFQDISLTLQNTSQRELHGTVQTQAPHLVVAGEAFMLAPGAIHTVILRFRPGHPGIYLANATVSSEAGTTTIGLRGMATAPGTATRTTHRTP